MYLELLRTYIDLTPDVKDSKEIKAVKYQARKCISRCINKFIDTQDKDWHTMEDRPNNEYYIVSGSQEGEMGIALFKDHWKKIIDFDGEEVNFNVMAWMELPLWFDWEKYQEEEPTEEELREQARAYYTDLEIDRRRGK